MKIRKVYHEMEDYEKFVFWMSIALNCFIMILVVINW
jgi:hypothetical protein